MQLAGLIFHKPDGQCNPDGHAPRAPRRQLEGLKQNFSSFEREIGELTWIHAYVANIEHDG